MAQLFDASRWSAWGELVIIWRISGQKGMGMTRPFGGGIPRTSGANERLSAIQVRVTPTGIEPGSHSDYADISPTGLGAG